MEIEVHVEFAESFIIELSCWKLIDLLMINLVRIIMAFYLVNDH